MYNASKKYWEKIYEQNRVFELRIRIEHEDGTIELTDKDIGLGSFKVMDATQAGEEFTFGGAVAQHLEFTIVNKGKYEGINFVGAKVIPAVSLLLEDSVDAHFVQPSQPSKMEGFESKWEYIPIGQFNIDIADRLRSTIEVKAIDNMILLDKPYSLSKISYPATLGGILNDVCSVAGVGTPVGGFLNSNYVVENRPSGDFTLRNIVGFIAELSGSFAKFDRDGRLRMKWYEETGVEITSEQRIELKLGDHEAQISGIRFDSSEKDEDGNNISYLAGTEDYMVDLTGNELLQGEYEVIIPKILSKVSNLKFTPYSADWRGNPAIDAGDVLTHIDLDGIRHVAAVTNNNYVYRGVSSMEGKALPDISRGFKSSDNRIASIVGKVEENFSSSLSNLQQEQVKATELISNMLGGYRTEIKSEDDPLYVRFGVGEFIHDAPKLADSTKIWKWGLGGFGYSDDGGKTYKTGITAEGSIVAELVSAGIITADMVRTGKLESNKGTSWFDLDNGEINIKNQLRFVDGELRLQSPDIPEDVDLSGIRSDISNIKNLSPNTVAGGRTTIDSSGIKVTHSGLGGQYSEMRHDGFVRKWRYGEAKYLNDIYSYSTNASNAYHTSVPRPRTVRLPKEFRGRQVNVSISLRNAYIDPINLDRYGDVSHIERMIDFVIDITNINMELDRPEIEVAAYVKFRDEGYQGDYFSGYRTLGFTLIVIGS